MSLTTSKKDSILPLPELAYTLGVTVRERLLEELLKTFGGSPDSILIVDSQIAQLPDVSFQSTSSTESTKSSNPNFSNGFPQANCVAEAGVQLTIQWTES